MYIYICVYIYKYIHMFILQGSHCISKHFKCDIPFKSPGRPHLADMVGPLVIPAKPGLNRCCPVEPSMVPSYKQT